MKESVQAAQSFVHSNAKKYGIPPVLFEKNDIPFIRADVGDKYVLHRLLKESWVLGGEPSGHIICLDSAPTGDAIIAALNLLNAIKDNNFSVKKSLEGFEKFPQTLINLKVNNPNKIIVSDKFWSEVTRIEKQLGQNGRVLIRPSGLTGLESSFDFGALGFPPAIISSI